MDLSAFSFHSDPIDPYLNPTDKQKLYVSSVEVRHAAGVNIFEEGTYPKGVYILKRGRVKIYQSASTGDEQIIAIHGAGEIFGYRPLLSGERYPVSARTVESCTITFIPKKDFLSVLKTSPSLSNLLLKYLSREFTVWVNTISLRSRTTVKERLLLTLLLLAERYREASKWPIRITLPKADLACLIGTSNETLARMLKGLKVEKVIVSRGRSIEIPGVDQLKYIQKEVSHFL